MNSYIFILCPPFSGSTLLWKLVSTSPAVSSLPKEGQFLPEVREIMRHEPWNPETRYPWERIKAVWEQYWDRDKPLLVEKSPPHIIRTNAIIEHFDPIYFIVMVRNPYAHTEGLMRRSNWGAQRAAEFSVRCLRQQAENAEKLDRTLTLTYEELVSDPAAVSSRIQTFIPEIGDLKHDRSFKLKSIDGDIERKIVNINQKKINNLSMGNLKQINKVFRDNIDVLQYWGYEYFEPSLRHAYSFLGARGSLVLSSVVSDTKRLTQRLARRIKKL